MPGRINSIRYTDVGRTQSEAKAPADGKKKGGFSRFMSTVADGALDTVSSVSNAIPGGQILGAAARGLKHLKNGGPDLDDPQAQIDRMWEMQRENQAFNLQYLQLQNAVQSDNRRFSTVSNLLKVRHDTAKSAINNMHV